MYVPLRIGWFYFGTVWGVITYMESTDCLNTNVEHEGIGQQTEQTHGAQWLQGRRQRKLESWKIFDFWSLAAAPSWGDDLPEGIFCLRFIHSFLKYVEYLPWTRYSSRCVEDTSRQNKCPCHKCKMFSDTGLYAQQTLYPLKPNRDFVK